MKRKLVSFAVAFSILVCICMGYPADWSVGRNGYEGVVVKAQENSTDTVVRKEPANLGIETSTVSVDEMSEEWRHKNSEIDVLYEQDGFLFWINKTEAYIYGYIGNQEEITVPNSLGGFPVTRVWLDEDNKFTAKKMTLPESITKLTEGSIYHLSSLEELILPDSITFLGRDAIASCSSLRTIRLPDNPMILDLILITNNSCSALEEIIVPEKIKCIKRCDPSVKLVLESKDMQRFAVQWNPWSYIIKNESPEIMAFKPVVLKSSVKYCYTEAAEILKTVNKKRAKKGRKKLKFREVLLDEAMECAFWSSVACNAPRITSLKTEQPKWGKVYEEEQINAFYTGDSCFQKEDVIRHLVSCQEKNVGIGVVKTNGNKFYFPLSSNVGKGLSANQKFKNKMVKKTAVLPSCRIQTIKAEKVSLSKGAHRKLKLRIRLQKNVQKIAAPHKSYEKAAKYFDSAGNIKADCLTYTSQTPSVAKVNGKGVVTGLKKGTAKIKISLKNDNSKSVVVKIKVK